MLKRKSNSSTTSCYNFKRVQATMSVERSLGRSLPYLPRYHSVSPAQSPRQFPTMIRSRSQPSQRISYFQGTVSKFLTHSRPSHSPSPQRVYLLCPGKKSKATLTRTSRSKSYSDLYSSHLYTNLEYDDVGEGEIPQMEVDARATSCDDIYHKGPFFPDVTQSESGVSMGCSEDSSLFGGDDDNTSQISYGSSSAFHEITIDSELDRLDSEDCLKSPREPSSWYRPRGLLSPDSDRGSPFPYADSRKRELMSSPSWEFDKTQSRHNALKVLIPTPDGSIAKDRLTRKNSSGGASTPLAQSTPHESPRSFMGPKLSIAGSWNADDPYDGDESYTTDKKVDDSSCYSSYSEDNLSDVSPSKHKSNRKVKLTKKASDLPAKKLDSAPFTSRRDQHQHDESLVSEESLENIYIPPLESAIGEDATGSRENTDREGGESWWAVYNIGAADARREEEKQHSSSPSDRENSKGEIKIVKPAKTGIPLISAGRYGKEKLKRHSQSSPPPANGLLSPKSSSPSLSDQSDDSQIYDVTGNGKGEGHERTPLVKIACRERAEDVLKKTKGHNLSNCGNGAFGVVRSSSSEEEEEKEKGDRDTPEVLDHLRNLACSDQTSVLANDDKENEISDQEKEKVTDVDTINQGTQFMKDKLKSDLSTVSYLPSAPALPLPIQEKKTESVESNHVDHTALDNHVSQVQIQLTTESPPCPRTTDADVIDSHSLRADVSEQTPEPLSEETRPVLDDIDYEADGSDSPDHPARSHHHDLLDNSNTREGQAGEASAILTTAPCLPGHEGTQVVVESVGGPRRGEGFSGLQQESDLTTYTPGIGGEEDNNNKNSSDSSLESTVQRAAVSSLPEPISASGSTDLREDEFEDLCSNFGTTLNICDPDGTLVSELESEAKFASKASHIDDSREREFEILCSKFAITLKISDPDKTLVDETEDDEDKTPTDSEIEFVKQVPVSSAPKIRAETTEKADGLADVTAKNATLSSSPILDGQSASNASGDFEILSGNVGLEGSTQRGPSNDQVLTKASIDPDQLEAGSSNMEWRFIDPKLLRPVGKSHWEERREGNEEAMEEGEEEFTSPFVVRIMATAELPRTCPDDNGQQWPNYSQATTVSQDGDTVMSNHSGANYSIQHQQLIKGDNQYCNPQLSEIPNNDVHSYDLNQNNVTRDAHFETKQSREIPVEKTDPNGSISYKYQSADGDQGEVAGIPRDEKTDAQNRDGASRSRRGEHEFLSLHSANESATTKCPADQLDTALCQQVKHIHRKTVEETVTLQHTSCGNLSVCDGSVEYVKNRTETTVIHEQDEEIVFTTNNNNNGNNSFVVFPKQNETVSSDDFPLTVNHQSSSVDDVTYSVHNNNNNNNTTFNHKESALPDAALSPSSLDQQPTLVADTNNFSTHTAPPLPRTAPPPLPSQESASQFNPDSAGLHTSTMKWRDGLTMAPAPTPFDPNADPTNVFDVGDNSMLSHAERGVVMKPSTTPVTHHHTHTPNSLDDLQAQLSQISGVHLDVPTSPTIQTHHNVYYDHGEATTTSLTTHALQTQGWAIGQHANTERTINIISNGHNNLSSSDTAVNKETGKSGVEVYDNGYDYVTDGRSKDTSSSHHSAPSPKQHQLLKPGQLKSSSLWTLQEETESLLDGLSPMSSPKRHFATAAIEERDEGRVSGTRNQVNGTECYSEIRYQDLNSAPPPSFLPTPKQRTFGSVSSDVDESDGNYSSISTADSFRSSSYGREQTPLSDSDIGVPGDYGVEKLNDQSQTNRSVGQTDDNIRSFHDFINGLESEPLTSDWTTNSFASASNNEFNQQGLIKFGEVQETRPSVFKSSVAFCVSNSHHQVSAQELTSENNGGSTTRHMLQSSENIPVSSTTFNFKKPFPAAPKLTGLSRFPVDDDTLSTSSIHDSEASFAQSEASSRLYALDLDLSRISSCASPTPSDFSDASQFVCKGTAEIKKVPSVSFEDDYDMLPAPTPRMPTSTPKPLKSVLKKPANAERHQQQQIIKNTAHEIWVNQFDKILEDFKNKTHPLGPESEVVVLEDMQPPGSPPPQGPNYNDMYRAFTNEDAERKQNNVCPIVEDDSMSTFRFKRFLKKSHTKRSKGRRLVRFLSRLSCVSESVHSPDLSATRKKAKLDSGQAYGTDFMPFPPERAHQPPTFHSSPIRQNHALPDPKDSPTSSNHSLDSCPSRTDSAYSSVSESFSASLHSPRHSSRNLTNSFNSVSNTDQFYLDSVNSSTSDYSSLGLTSISSDPFSPRPEQRKSQEMLTALSDVFDQLDVCEGEIDNALLNRLRFGHHTVHSNNRDA